MPSKRSAEDCVIGVGSRAKHIVIHFRWPRDSLIGSRGMVDDLIRLKVDLIVAPTSLYTDAAKRATSTIPIVFASHADPVGTGHVANLARLRVPTPLEPPSS